MTEPEPGVGARAGQSIADKSPQRSEQVFKAAAWVLGGFSLLTAGLGALTVVPRIANGYMSWTVAAVIFIVAAFFGAFVAVAFAYNSSYAADKKWWRDGIRGPIALAASCLLVGISIVLIVSVLVLGRSEVPRLTLSVTPQNATPKPQAPVATVKLKFEADSMDPGGFFVVEMIGLRTWVAGAEFQQGERIYLSVVGSDSAGRIVSEVQTEIPMDRYKLVVAEVFPGPRKDDGKVVDLAANLATTTTKMCADTNKPDARACVYSLVPGAELKPPTSPS